MTEPPFLGSTRVFYDTVAADYAEHLRAELADRPMDRALLTVFAELVRAAGAGPVADLGCGPGAVTAQLHTLGLAVFGVDLSPQMVAQARQAHPGLRFDEGSMSALDLPDGALGGITAFYSIMHTPPELLPAVFAEFHRVLAPGGHVLLAFLVGDEQFHRTEAYGRAVSIDYFLRPAERVGDAVSRAGLVIHAQMLREPHGDAEKRPRAYLLARKPDETDQP
ncbi:MAG: methyltransferase domain-containing protein [Actinobacteria bacterium]|nr:methyltransferase domain-containing protein [Actinomycetota bacterium]MBI3686730.1 methyltransferase domain-containing protein [Actinomycetota bacterium]